MNPCFDKHFFVGTVKMWIMHLKIDVRVTPKKWPFFFIWVWVVADYFQCCIQHTTVLLQFLWYVVYCIQCILYNVCMHRICGYTKEHIVHNIPQCSAIFNFLYYEVDANMELNCIYFSHWLKVNMKLYSQAIFLEPGDCWRGYGKFRRLVTLF